MTIIITCGSLGEKDFSALPESSQKAMAQKAANHLFNNVLDSKVLAHYTAKPLAAWVKAETKPGKGKDAKPVLPTDVAIKAQRKALFDAVSDEDKATQKALFAEETYASLLDGTFITKAGGKKKTPREAMVETVTMELLTAEAKARSVKLPTGEALATMIDRFGTKKAETIEAMVNERLAALEALATSTDNALDDIFS